MGAALLAALASLPATVGRLLERAPVIREWDDPVRQQELAIGEGIASPLIAADRRLDRRAAVILVTSGEDVRGREYRAFNRALYFLAPRPVWWVVPAPPDGTWESRWWTTTPLEAAAIERRAREHETRCLLLDRSISLSLEGRRLELGGSGWALVELPAEPSPRRPACWTESLAAPDQPSPVWPLLGAAALLVVLALGSAVLALLGTETGLPGALAASFVIGSAGAGLLTLALASVGVGRAGQLAWVTLIALVAQASLALASSRSRRFWRALARAGAPSSSGSSWPWVAAIGIGAALVLALSVGAPIGGWDGWATWVVKARSLFREGGALTPSLLADPSRAVTLPGYPLLLPLAQGWLFAWIGAPDDRLVGLVSWGYYLSLLGLTHECVRRFAGPRRDGRRVAILTTALVALTPHVLGVSVLGMAETPLAALALLTAGALIRWLGEGGRGGWCLAVLAASLLPWTKREGLALVAALAIGALVVDRLSRRALIGAASMGSAAAIVAAAWWWGPAHLTVPFADFAAPAAGVAASLSRLPTVARLEAPVLAGLGFALVWPLAAAVGIARRVGVGRAGAARADLLPVAAAVYLLVVTLGYLVSDYAPFQQHVLTSFYRLAMHVYPLVVVWLGLQALDPPESPAEAGGKG